REPPARADARHARGVEGRLALVDERAARRAAEQPAVETLGAGRDHARPCRAVVGVAFGRVERTRSIDHEGCRAFDLLETVEGPLIAHRRRAAPGRDPGFELLLAARGETLEFGGEELADAHGDPVLAPGLEVREAVGAAGIVAEDLWLKGIDRRFHGVDAGIG